MNVTPSRVVVCFALLGAVGCQTHKSAESRSLQYMERANYYQAYHAWLDDGGGDGANRRRQREGSRKPESSNVGHEPKFYTVTLGFPHVLRVSRERK